MMFRGSPPMIAPLSSSTFICAEGDSVTQNLASGLLTYPNKYAPDTSIVNLINKAHAGDQLSSVVGREAADIALIGENPGFSNYIYTVLIGFNDSGNPTYYPDNGAQYAADIGALCDAIKAGGYTKVLVCTLPPFQPTPALVAWLTAVNAGILGLYPAHADGIIDFANATPFDTAIGISHNRSLYLDGLHPTDLGQIYLERIYAWTVNSIIAGAVAPASPTNLRSNYMKPTIAYLTWDYPTSGGYTSSFSIQYRVAGAESWTTFSQPNGLAKATTAYIRGLSANTSYEFRVAAVGPHGTSSYIQKTIATPASVANTFDTETNVPNTGVLFSNGNLDATSQPQGYECQARTNIGKSSGKWYAEIAILGGGNNNIGICDDTLPILPLWFDLGAFTNSAFANNVVGFTLVNTPILDYSTGTTIMLAFDCDAKKAWIGANGVWPNSGNPATGANPWVTWAGNRTIYPCVDIDYLDDAIRYLAEAPTYSVPSGFSVLE